MRNTVWIAAVLALGACAPAGQGTMGEEVRPRMFTVPLYDAQGRGMGTLSAVQRGASVQVRLEATGMPAGTHGAHFHEAGLCEGPAFTSAGGHLNPTGRQHGLRNPNGPHLGDLPNLVVGADGRGTLEATIAGSLTRARRRSSTPTAPPSSSTPPPTTRSPTRPATPARASPARSSRHRCGEDLTQRTQRTPTS
jgi:Cu-Zn family superoxide dismutase